MLLASGASSALLAQTAPDHGRLFLRPWRAPPGQECFQDSTAPPPSVDDLLDTVSLGAALQGQSPGSVVLSAVMGPRPVRSRLLLIPGAETLLVYDSLAVVESSLPAQAARAVRESVLRVVRPQLEATFLLRVDVGEEVRVRAAPALECGPALRQGSRTLSELARDLPAGRTVAQVVVGADGRTIAALIVRSSGSERTDRSLERALLELSFHPMRVNRLAVPTVTMVPIGSR